MEIWITDYFLVNFQELKFHKFQLFKINQTIVIFHEFQRTIIFAKFLNANIRELLSIFLYFT